jgi:hypothetical protein
MLDIVHHIIFIVYGSTTFIVAIRGKESVLEIHNGPNMMTDAFLETLCS